MTAQQCTDQIIWQRETPEVVVEVKVKVPQSSAIRSEQHQDRIEFRLRESHADGSFARSLPRYAGGPIGSLCKIDKIDQGVGHCAARERSNQELALER